MIYSFPFLRRADKYLRLAIFCSLIFVAGGCGNDSSDGEQSETANVDLSQLSDRAKTDEQESDSPWNGRWELLLSNHTRQSPLILLQIEERAGHLQARMLDKAPTPELEKLKLAGIYFRENGILVALQSEENKLSFEGTLHKDIVLGSFYSEGGISPAPARLIKSSNFNLQGVELQQVVEHTKEYEAAVAAPDPIAALDQFIKEYPDNPLIFSAGLNRLTKAIEKKTPADQVMKMTEQMKKTARRWGDSLIIKIYVEVLERLIERPAYREIVVKNFGEIKKLVGNAPTDTVKNLLLEFQARVDLADTDKAKQKAGEAAVKQIIKKNHFYLKLVITLAEYYERNRETKQALKIYSRLAALPGVASAVRGIKNANGDPVDVIKKTRSLWKGKDADFEKYLDEVYEKEAFFFIEKEKPKIELRKGRRITLVELFTGSACQPCVAADIALGGVEKTLPVPEFIAVRYHQHIPGPDPLTVSSGEARFGYYSGQGTPLMAINGRQTGNVGGLIFHAQAQYQGLYPRIKNLISQISLVNIDLQVGLEKSVLKIQAKAEGIPKLRKDAKLRLLIVDPRLRYIAGNGIRFHEMVVREMPGGHEGVLASQGKAEVKVERSLVELQSEIIKGLKSLEENRGMKFDFLPPELKQVHVIAFVQDDGTHEILQSAISPLLTVSP